MEKDRERMLELLADQTLFGLTEGETAELENLKNRFSEFKDDSFEMTAAAINLVNLQITDSLPAHLQTKLEAQAQEFFAAPQKNQTAVTDESANIIHEVPSKSSIWNWKWLTLAGAAACIALAIGLWLNRSEPQPEIAKTQKTIQTPESEQIPEATRIPETEKSPEIVKIPEPVKTPEPLKSPVAAKTPESAKIPKTTVIHSENVKVPTPVKTPPSELTAAQKREQLLASATDVIQTIWTSAKDDKRAMGDVVWSNSQQKGYVRLRDLPVLDPNRETYQLWIVDEAQNKKTPISGGIFNVSQAGEIIIPINAQLRIQKPKQFAVTKEKAGGVVVSKPDRVVAVAKI